MAAVVELRCLSSSRYEFRHTVAQPVAESRVSQGEVSGVLTASTRSGLGVAQLRPSQQSKTNSGSHSGGLCQHSSRIGLGCSHSLSADTSASGLRIRQRRQWGLFLVDAASTSAPLALTLALSSSVAEPAQREEKEEALPDSSQKIQKITLLLRNQQNDAIVEDDDAQKEGLPTKTPRKNIAPSIRSRRSRDWEKARDLLATGRVWRTKVEGLNEGGARLRFGSLLAFLPFSQMEPRPSIPDLRKAEGLVGTQITVQAMEVDETTSRLVMSERKAAKKLRMSSLQVGQVCSGVISGVMDYGAFVDFVGPDGTPTGVGGLVHTSELSWDSVISASTAVFVGQRVKVKIIRMEKGRGRMGLSIKQVQADPLLDTLDALLPSSDTHNNSTYEPVAEELLGAALPGLGDLCKQLRDHQGILEVSMGRQALERRVVSQDLELWLSNTAAQNGDFTLVARAGRLVQEVFVKSSLDREGMKAAVLTVTPKVP